MGTGFVGFGRVWILAGLATAAVILAESALQLGGRPVASAVCFAAPMALAVTMAGSALFRRRP